MENNQPAVENLETITKLNDQSIPVIERIELARGVVRAEGQTNIFLGRMGIADGVSFYDKNLPINELKALVDELGFGEVEYESISEYEWHTRSVIHPDLMLQVVEGPISIGAATELFPSGSAWSEYDHTDTYSIIVSSSVLRTNTEV